MRGDLLSIVEAAYRVEDDDAHWLGAVLSAARPSLYTAFGGVGVLYDRNAVDRNKVLSALTIDGLDERLAATILQSFERGTQEERDRSLRRAGPIVRLSEICGMPLMKHPTYGPLATSLGVRELVSVNGANPDGLGVYIAAAVGRTKRDPRAWDARWSLIAAHIAAGLRLQSAAKKLVADESDAVLSPDGRVLHARGAATPAREALRRAAATIDRARGRARREDPSGALDAWTALTSGRWSLVDSFDTDGKRFVLAVPNLPSAPDPRALSEDERPILHYVVMGHSNKLIAYELGLPEGTVATRIAALARKLGVTSRTAIIDRYMTLREAAFVETPIAREPILVGRVAGREPEIAALTTAERAVAALASRGLDNRRIARERGCAVRTVANQLASVYRKLSVTSRAELTIALSRA